jgi:hypothetical protein
MQSELPTEFRHDQIDAKKTFLSEVENRIRRPTFVRVGICHFEAVHADSDHNNNNRDDRCDAAGRDKG